VQASRNTRSTCRALHVSSSAAQDFCNAHIVVTAERAAASTQFAAFLLISAHDAGVLPPYNGNKSGLPLVTIEIMVILLFRGQQADRLASADI
jgi:hypothetical protein